MAEHKKQHFVPQFYLKRFSSDGSRTNALLFKGQKLISAASVKEQCVENYFYGADLTLEKKLSSQIEGPAATVIESIVTKKILPEPQTEEFAALLGFLLVQHGRTTYAADEINESTEYLKEFILDPYVKNGVLTQEEVQSLEIQMEKPVFWALQISTTMLPLVTDLAAKLLFAHPGEEFITSDNPVALCNPFLKGEFPGSTTGWALSGLQAFLPISPRMVIVFFDNRIYKVGNKRELEISLSVDDTSWVNRLQLSNGVNCAYFSELKIGSKLHQELNRHPYLRRSTKLDRQIVSFSNGEELCHSYKQDIPIVGTLSVCKLLRRSKAMAFESGCLPLRQPELVEVHERFLNAVRKGLYKPTEFLRFLADIKS